MGASPTRLSSSDVFCRSVIIESAEGNTGKIYISANESNSTTLNRHVLYCEGDMMVISGSEFADLNAELNLNNIWIHGTNSGDRLVVSYIDITGDFC